MPKPPDLSVTGLRRRHVLTRARNCQGVGAITPQADLVVLLGRRRRLSASAFTATSTLEPDSGGRRRCL